MKPLPPLLALLLAAGCAAPRPSAPVRDVVYSAVGADPFWMLTIGEDRIVLTRGGPGDERPHESVYPRALPREVDGVRIWQSGEGVQAITIEARPGRCVGPSGILYEDQVRVRLTGLELEGCGGRMFAGRRG
ncbi:MAG: hypothetical protein M3N07_04155 [Pseudomonadota bacterium]|nr:hypothetical protein [Pseudomonadota bacterium]